jgi:hydroxyacyl-ACP dehydratase HTD2-like protein with hotdog domain
MWAGGKIVWNNTNPLLVGSRATATSTIASADGKGFESGKPIIFVNQKIDVAMQGNSEEPSLTEIRTHAYLPFNSRPASEPREVNDVPSKSDFSFTYSPSLITLFRFSALTFNAHHVHLDKDITQLREGYPERLVHGPLTALMLLETAALSNPGLRIKSFEYRAVNPMFVNRTVTLNGTWLDDSTAKLWCADQSGVVGMIGTIEKDV